MVRSSSSNSGSRRTWAFRYAYAMAGDSPPYGWGGGTGFDDLTDDQEIAFFMGSNEVDCD